MRGVQRAVVSLPDGLDRQLRLAARASCAARPGCESPRALRRSPLDPSWDLAAAAARSHATRSSPGRCDEHGRFPASASCARAGRGAARRARAPRCARPTGAPASRRPVSRRRPLRRRADARHRHALALERSRAAAAPPPASRERWRAATSPTRPRRGRRVSRSRPLHRLRGTDPNWCFARFAAARGAARLPLDLLRARRASRPARRRARRRPTTSAGRGSWRARRGSGARSACTRATPAGADERLLRRGARRARAACSAAPVARQPPPLPAPALARGHPRARPARLRLRHDARLRRAARPARRALVPVPALGRTPPDGRSASSSSRSC